MKDLRTMTADQRTAYDDGLLDAMAVVIRATASTNNWRVNAYDAIAKFRRVQLKTIQEERT